MYRLKIKDEVIIESKNLDIILQSLWDIIPDAKPGEMDDASIEAWCSFNKTWRKLEI